MKSTSFVLSSIALCIILSGCASPDDVNANGVLLKADSLASKHSLANDRLSVANWPRKDWWDNFGDPALSGLINEALAHSPSLEVANARLEAADAQVSAADSAFSPTLDANASFKRSRLSRLEDPSGLGNRFSTVRSGGLTFNYDFDLWGGKRAAWEATVNQQKASEVDYQAARIALSTSITRTYIQLANAYEMHDLAIREFERSEKIAQITQTLLKSGLVAEDRLLAANTSESVAKQQIEQQSLVIRQLKNSLSTLLGQGPDRADSLPRPHLLAAQKTGLPDNVPASLISHRPDMTAALWRVEAASKNIVTAKSRYYPDFNLTAMAGFKSILGDAILGDVSQSWSVAPAISIPLFETGLRANLETKTAAYDMAVAQYNQTLTNALGDVADNVLVLQSLKQQLADSEDTLMLANKTYQVSAARFHSGLGSQLAVLMAEQQLIQAETQLSTLKTRQQDSLALLIQSLGGGFNADENSGLSHLKIKNS
jgi:NodT family efflux transporter outer membrane factor (OMF) lipoprotein